MQILPVSIATSSSVAGLMPAWRVRGARGAAPAGQCAEPQGSDPAAESQDADTLEISAEAEAALVGQLSEADQQIVQELTSADREVRTHEQAHLAAAGPYATGGPTFQYTKGPDGRRYATAGEVQIDTAPIEGDPEATLRKAQVIRAAAMAPSHPSAQDRQVAAAAARMEAEAQPELQAQQQVQREGRAEDGTEDGNSPTGTLFDAAA